MAGETKVYYRNKHTGNLRRIVRTDTVKNHAKSIVVFVLDDGTRWEQGLFDKNHVLAKKTEVDPRP